MTKKDTRSKSSVFFAGSKTKSEKYSEICSKLFAVKFFLPRSYQKKDRKKEYSHTLYELIILNTGFFEIFVSITFFDAKWGGCGLKTQHSYCLWNKLVCKNIPFSGKGKRSNIIHIVTGIDNKRFEKKNPNPE